MQPDHLMDADEWLVRADSDMYVATLALQANPMSADGVAFHAHQVAEKSMKGFLTAHGVRFPKTHELERLVALCTAIEPRFQSYFRASAILSPYSTEFRYPGRRREPSEAEARTAFQYATEILQFVRAMLPGTGSSSQ